MKFALFLFLTGSSILRMSFVDAENITEAVTKLSPDRVSKILNPVIKGEP